MAIEFVNIRTKERVKLTRPHQIGAYINSSDLGRNAANGQDFHWRLAPEVVVRLDEMRQDYKLLENISQRRGIPIDELTTIHLVQHISYEESLQQRAKKVSTARKPEYQDDYEDEIRKLKSKSEPKSGSKSESKSDSGEAGKSDSK